MPKIGNNPSKGLQSRGPSRRRSKGQTAKGANSLAKRQKRSLNAALGGDDQRVVQFNSVLIAMRQVPQDWIHLIDPNETRELTALPCSNYRSLTMYWKKAMKWRTEMCDVLSIMLAVSASTVQQGDQLFVMVVGNPSGGKSQFCDGMTISKNCYQLESLTGFTSGYQDNEGNDYSLITRVDRKCMVTSEGDVLLSNPQVLQIMAQQRRMFDGQFTSSYKNLKEDRQYNQLRLTWIIAGTPAMMEREQASLGDRFLKVYLESPPDHEKREILTRVSNSAWNALKINTDEDSSSITNAAVTEAQQRLAGYIDHLRDNTNELLTIDCDQKWFSYCEELAFFVAILRSRPPKTEDAPATLEEPHRLNHQFVRIMGCLALVLNRKKIDEEVIRRVKKVALDTGRGVVLDLLTEMSKHDEFVTVKSLAIQTDRTEDTIKKVLRFLRKLKIVVLSTDLNAKQPKSKRQHSRKPLWGLSDQTKDLCDSILWS